TVPDYQLSLAIGKEGQNARLAAKLTGCRVDIRSETQAADEERSARAPAPPPPEPQVAEEPVRAEEVVQAEEPAPGEAEKEPVLDATAEERDTASAEEPAPA